MSSCFAILFPFKYTPFLYLVDSLYVFKCFYHISSVSSFFQAVHVKIIKPFLVTFSFKLQELTALVRDNLQVAQTKQKRWYDRSAWDRTFQIALRPVKQNKLQAAWEGPYKLIEKICDTTFIAARCSDERIQRTFHVNMLKPFHEREEAVAAICAPDAGDLEDLPLPVLPGDPSAQGIADVRLGEGLSPRHREQAQQVLWEHQDLFSSRPGYTSVALHRVDTQSQTPLRQTAYRIPDAVRDGMQKEIREMLDLGVIEPPESPWASPVVLVPKKDGTTRFCVDYRRLNEHTVTDACPMPRVDELLDHIAQGHFLTTIDLCKGYWQIPLAEEGVPKSAFITPFGLYQFRVMPFGMKNAPATFQRMVDRLLEGMQDFTSAYLDDIAILSNTWEDHLQHLRAVLDRLGTAGLTVKPDKCHVGMSEVQYLGHRVGCGRQRPKPAKVEAVAQWPTPRTKTQVLAFLGTAGYYRRFVPNYSAIAKPLTDLTRKNLPTGTVVP
uniref:ribonuclease H n=1 Tax=Leptobrachium leishanense TaxID=445787 RepID=A0A8C5PG64_9ANUR